MGLVMVVGSIIGATAVATKAKGGRWGVIVFCLSTAYFTWAGGIKG